MLLPALNKAKMKATGAACKSNMKQLQLAFIMYATDNKDAMPGLSFRGNNMNGGGYWVAPAVAAAAGDWPIGTPIATALSNVLNGFKLGPLWTYDNAGPAYHCPGDMRSQFSVPGKGWAYDSYSKCDPMGFENNVGWVSPGQDISKTLDVPDPVRSIVFVEEADSRGYNEGTWALNVAATPPGYEWVDSFAQNHIDTGSFSFSDGHVEGHKFLEKNTITAGLNASRSGSTMATFYWTRAQPVDLDMNWIIPRYQYLHMPAVDLALP
jgi:hypothetical protein